MGSGFPELIMHQCYYSDDFQERWLRKTTSRHRRRENGWLPEFLSDASRHGPDSFLFNHFLMESSTGSSSPLTDHPETELPHPTLQSTQGEITWQILSHILISFEKTVYFLLFCKCCIISILKRPNQYLYLRSPCLYYLPTPSSIYIYIYINNHHFFIKNMKKLGFSHFLINSD